VHGKSSEGGPRVNDREFAYLKQVIRKVLNFDAESYRSTQMRRRLSAFMLRRGEGSVAMLCKRLQADYRLRDELMSLLTINVSEFFRDPAQFELLQQVILPALAANGATVRMWSAGCAQGEEPYTLAMLCDILGISTRADILATDIDTDALTQAKAGGPYTLAHVRKTPPEFLRHYIEETPNGYFVRDAIRRRVRFARHDLITGPIGRQFDFISCRNVTIYFTPEVKTQLIKKFFGALRPGGYLFIGGAESLLGSEGAGFSRIAGNVYQRISQPAKQPAVGART
jgi:chemotaxis protein methyltransferase CheR